MTYLSDYAGKTVETITAKDTVHGPSPFALIRFTDGDQLTVFVEGREFYDKQGAEVNTGDFDAAYMDRYSSGGVIRTPQPPRWREPQDRILRSILSEFKLLSTALMDLCGERHFGLDRKPYIERWEAAMERWRRHVRSLYGYDRYLPDTHPALPVLPRALSFFERLRVWLKPKPSNPYERDRK